MSRGIGGAALAALGLLAGCGSSQFSNDPPAPCPRISILADGADLTRFREGSGRDLAAMQFDARLIGFQARCDYTRRREGVAVEVSAIFDVERGPAAAPEARLPWFAVVTDANDGQIIDRQEFTTPVRFENNVNQSRVVSRAVRFTFPADERLVENHNLRLSFQVTPEELAHNRRRGPR